MKIMLVGTHQRTAEADNQVIIKSRLSFIVWVNIVVNKTVVVHSD